MEKQFAASEVRRLSNRIPRSNDEIADAQEALRAFADMLETQERAVPVELDFYDAGLLNDFGGGNVIWWWDYMRDELGRAHSFYQSQVNDMMLAAHSAQAQPKNVPFVRETWPEDADGDLPDLCTVCGKPVLYGTRHTTCTDAQIQPNIPDLTDEEWEILFHLYPELKARLQKVFDAHSAQAPPPAASATPNLASYWRIVAEAAEVLQMVLDSGVKLPPNWRWPLLDELSGLSAMMLAAQENPNG